LCRGSRASPRCPGSRRSAAANQSLDSPLRDRTVPPLAGLQFAGLRPARLTVRTILGGLRRVRVPATVTGHLPKDLRHDPRQPLPDQSQRLPQATPRATCSCFSVHSGLARLTFSNFPANAKRSSCPVYSPLETATACTWSSGGATTTLARWRQPTGKSRYLLGSFGCP
jgi:hypothetical protein